jgi:hypothetical protein
MATISERSDPCKSWKPEGTVTRSSKTMASGLDVRVDGGSESRWDHVLDGRSDRSSAR